jgi:hypothetical protein
VVVLRARAAPTSQPSDTVVAEWELGEFTEPILLPVKWKNLDKYFLVDTGASITTVDETMFGDLKPTGHKYSIVSGSGKEVVLPTFEPPDLKIGPIDVCKNGPVLRTDLAAERILTGFPIVGIIGIDALQDYIVQIDFDAKRFRLLSRKVVHSAEWGVELPLEFEFGAPQVRLSIFGRNELFLIDTGCLGDGMLRQKLFDQAAATTQKVVVRTSASAAGFGDCKLVRMPMIEVGGQKYSDLAFNNTQLAYSVLGSTFAFRNLVTLDLVGKRLYLKPGRELSSHYFNMTGIGLARIGDETFAIRVFEGEPGYEAGLRDHDVLLEVDGKSISGESLSAIAAMLRGDEGRKVVVKYRRGNTVGTVQIVLRRLL